MSMIPAALMSQSRRLRTQLRQPLNSSAFGLPRAFFFDGLAPDIAESVTAAIELLSKMTNGVREVTVPAVTDLLYLADAEVYTFHATYLRNTPTLYNPRFANASRLPPQSHSNSTLGSEAGR